jgi:AraC family transcriptional regulator
VTDLTPTVLQSAVVTGGRAELLEWRWPEIIDFVRSEDELMIEMSLPPTAGDGSVCLPDIAPDKRCILGTLFVRWPGLALHGRCDGGHIRVVRCVIAADKARALIAQRPEPGIDFLQSLLTIRSDALRSMMRLLHRELTNPSDRSDAAIAALVDLITVELARLVAREPEDVPQGRLAAWQFRKIRARLAQGGTAPTVAELAALCGISPRHLHRQFLALTGKTVADYIEAARIEEAKRLLALRERPIKAVALACGFAHANSFARAFRRSTGISPQSFRQRAMPAVTAAPA